MLRLNQSMQNWYTKFENAFHQPLYNMYLYRAWIKHTTFAKCNLFFLYHDAKEILLYYSHNTKHLYCWDHVSKVNDLCLVDCFHREFRVSTQIMVHDYCIVKCKKFSACGRFLMALCAIFLCFKVFMLIGTLLY